MFTPAIACRSVAFAAVLCVSTAWATAQVPQPGAEPGSVPEAQPATQMSAPPPARRARISGGVIAGLRLGGENPVYPEEAKAKGIGGSVVLHAIIGNDGHIASLTVVAGISLLADAALAAVQTWTYRPYLLNGEPTEVDTTITVNFNMSAPEGPNVAAGASSLPTIPQRDLNLTRTSSVSPVYPADAKAAHVSGSVVMDVIVAADGHVQSLHVISGPPMLQNAALEAVRQWRYRPYIANGQPSAVHSQVTVNFALAE